ncbi:ABC transporter family substrate-binding protein [Thermobispora bispora]|uniref:Extracellular solute-binding protein family 5 n=1 Tax=Thermobispora bispora (strain ATCC 19993 / DSM 43833 / CBS 139.67 / JCM 10125 / KCTC 9307 / NBRC 14880 / R51) TaxID=469371 RepID=D6Y404_THEBD|nr:ABC transporter family substrate-binding protein [Thermobispora bispora]ADG89106.1 extracellular solute-binding protein family 5 [Thermobispora bispora DSM 43833]MBX6166344.1 ABC transporter family substrate-binding protein [Thermobispora bispora]MDI9581833.1 ABC transporter family substrate-binding protein [Thermobispora sp.]
MRARWPVALTVLVFLWAVGACGAAPPSGGRDGTPLPSPVKALDINQVARDKVKNGGTLRWGLSDFPTQWNYNHADGSLANVKVVISALLPRVFRSDERGRLSLDTDYVTNARITATSPNQVITYTINPKARWSDGKPITWEDFAAQWKAMSGRDGGYRADSSIAYENIKSVARGSSDREVVVTLAEPFNEWQSLFTPLYPRSTNASPDEFNSGWINRIPVTAGPFQVEKFDAKGKTITLARSPQWWGNPAKLDRIEFRHVQPTTMLRAFTKGEIDVFDIGPSPENYAAVREVWDAVVRQAAGPEYRQLTFNGESEVLSDLRVRQAIALAIDRKAIMEIDLKGLGWPIVTLDHHFLMNSQYGYRSNAGAHGAYDPKRAARLLDEAGWKLSGKVRSKNGKPLRLRFVVPAGVRVTETQAQVVRLMLQKIGVQVDVARVRFQDFFTKHLLPGKFDITAFSYPSSPFPISSAYDIYANGEPGRGDEVKWYSNLGRSGSSEIDQAMYDAGSTLDQKEVIELIHAADALIWEKVNVLPLYQVPQNVAVRSTLANVGANGFYDLRYEDIGYVS